MLYRYIKTCHEPFVDTNEHNLLHANTHRAVSAATLDASPDKFPQMSAHH